MALSHVHDDRKNHGAALGFGVNEFGKVIAESLFQIHPIHGIPIVEHIQQCFGCNAARLVHELLGFPDVNEAARNDVRSGDERCH